MSYADFLRSKERVARPDGPIVAYTDMSPAMHEWQRHIVAWALKTGRAAIWSDTGTGKSRMSLAWAYYVAKHTGQAVLMVAPLAVCKQFVGEGQQIDVDVEYVRHPDEITNNGVWITNYEMIHHFNPADFAGVVLDEASILKQSDGKTRTALIEWASGVHYRLTATATPAPNDPEELTNQAEFLGHMRRVDMLAAYFIHDDDGWRLKGHARAAMMKWIASWAIALRKPSDIGWPDDGYDLPGLNLHKHLVATDVAAEGQLFATDLGGVSGRAKVRKDTVKARCAVAAELVAAEPDEPWLLWAGLNSEAEMLADMTGAVNVHGSMKPEEKAELLLAFGRGEIQRMISKPQIASQGLNYQRCARMAFVGLSDSYEQYYQAIRRCYRYGQTRVVEAHIILSDLEASIYTNVLRKEKSAASVTEALVKEMAAVHRYRKDI